MQNKKEIHDHLKEDHVGRENAVSSRELEQRFSMNGRAIRRVIHSLRQDGCPICSEKRGYYYASSQSEINGTVSRLTDFMNGVSDASTALLNSKIPSEQMKVTFTVTMDAATAEKLGFCTFHSV